MLPTVEIEYEHWFRFFLKKKILQVQSVQFQIKGLQIAINLYPHGHNVNIVVETSNLSDDDKRGSCNMHAFSFIVIIFIINK